MNEFSFIDSIKQLSYSQPTLNKGVGDDAAVFQQDSKEIVTAVDTFVDEVHFSRQTMSPFQIGYRSLAANISDLAAMGAEPAFYLVSIVIPRSWKTKELQNIFTGMKDLAKEYKMDLIGGDTVSGNELVISITVIGYAQSNKVRYRSLAKPDDIVFVTGTVGDSQAGLHILTHADTYDYADHFVQRHQLPTPRVNFSQKLSHLHRLCLNDVSDGIGNEAIEIATNSNVGIVLEERLIPTSAGFEQFDEKLQEQWKLFGGEDFELLGTISPKDWPGIEKVSRSLHINVTKIGSVIHENAGQVFLKSSKNNVYPLRKDGYQHLK